MGSRFKDTKKHTNKWIKERNKNATSDIFAHQKYTTSPCTNPIDAKVFLTLAKYTDMMTFTSVKSGYKEKQRNQVKSTDSARVV